MRLAAGGALEPLDIIAAEDDAAVGRRIQQVHIHARVGDAAESRAQGTRLIRQPIEQDDVAFLANLHAGFLERAPGSRRVLDEHLKYALARETVDALPPRVAQPDGAFVERYESNVENELPHVPDGFKVAADFEFEGSATIGSIRYVVLGVDPAYAAARQIGEGSVVVSIGPRRSPLIETTNDWDAFHLGLDNMYIDVLGSRNGAVIDFLPAVDAVVRSDVAAAEVLAGLSRRRGRLGESSGMDELREVIGTVIEGSRGDREHAAWSDEESLEVEHVDEVEQSGTGEPSY